MAMDQLLPDRETNVETPNPIGLDGIEYIEYSTSHPQALGQLLERIGFRPVARHRSREVLLYRQGSMNMIVNAHAGAGGARGPDETPRISAIALRVRDARVAYEYVLDRGAWDIPMHAQVMELNIPGIHGPGGSHIYFVDRYREFSIYDVDFTLIPTVDPKPPAPTGMHYFGLVQYIGIERTADWIEFYRELFGFGVLPDEQRFGILPKGKVLASPCGRFHLQLIEPLPSNVTGAEVEMFQRIGFGTPDVLATAAAMRGNGIEFFETELTHTEARGALTRTYLGSVLFELVHAEPSRREVAR
ncbi:MAG TPA: VOC family protein [Burkholderiaceae bacterium]|nr:VOC family protein [Burkholderiaceae bacterium]